MGFSFSKTCTKLSNQVPVVSEDQISLNTFKSRRLESCRKSDIIITDIMCSNTQGHMYSF